MELEYIAEVDLDTAIEALKIFGIELDQDECKDFLKYLEEKNGK